MSETVKLIVCGWNGKPRHCVYLDDYRIAGTKPWGGASDQTEFTVTIENLQKAIPQFRAAMEALKALDSELDFSADIDDRHPLTEICAARLVNKAFAKARIALNIATAEA